MRFLLLTAMQRSIIINVMITNIKLLHIRNTHRAV